MEHVDYIIVGAGSSGCMLAARLSADPATRILLIEAGAENTSALTKDPTAWPAIWETPDNYAYETTVNAATGHVYDVPRGRVFGGSGAINAMLYVRGARSDFDGWAASGARGWSYDEVLPYFKRMETAAGDPTYRGTDGPLRPGKHTAPHPLSVAFVEASQEAGHALNDDFNTGELFGTGLADLLIHGGARDSTGNVLDSVRASRDNLTVWTEATVRRLVLDGTRCTGVELVRAGETITVAAEREVVVCAGTVDSPRLLLRSGIGPADELEQIGIEVVHDLPGVGRNLQDHPMANVVWESSQAVPAGSANMAEAITYLMTSHARDDTPDIQIAFMHVAFYTPWQTGPTNGYTMGVSLMRPLGRGTVRLSSADPDDEPLIDVDYLGRDEDVAALLEGVEKAIDIGAAAAFDPWRGREVLPGAHDEETLRAFLRDGVRSYTHIVGTCRMGDGPDAVVDPELRVHGITGLRVADGSVMPSNVSANTNPTCIMIAEKAADLIRSDAPAR